MYIQPTEEEFGIAVESFIDTYEDFRKAAKKTCGYHGQHEHKKVSRIKSPYQGQSTNKIKKFLKKSIPIPSPNKNGSSYSCLALPSVNIQR